METNTYVYISFGMAFLSMVIALSIFFFVLEKRAPVVQIPPGETTSVVQ